MDAVLREPRADGFLTTERLCIDQELIRNEDLSLTEADDQDAGPLISTWRREGGALEMRGVTSHAYIWRLVSPAPGQWRGVGSFADFFHGVPSSSPRPWSVRGGATERAPARFGPRAFLSAFLVFR